MNKRWTDQKYVIYFLLSVMVLGVCGSVSYGLACCQTKAPRDKEAGLVKAVGEVDERYVPYRASEQRTIEIEFLAYKDNGQNAAAGTEAAVAQGFAAVDEEAAETQDIAAVDEEAAETQDIAAVDEEAAEMQEAADADAQTMGQAVAVSAEDYEALLRIVQAEAGNEDTKGKILVANVVLNRVADARFPNTVYEVVFQRAGGRAQFSPVASGSYYKVVVSDDTREAVDRALAGEDYSEGALFFAARRYAGSSQMRWFDECLTKLFSYGGHEFFTR